MLRDDLKWWAGAIGAALAAFGAIAALPHPYETYVLGAAAALGAFSLYKITPGDSVKKG